MSRKKRTVQIALLVCLLFFCLALKTSAMDDAVQAAGAIVGAEDLKSAVSKEAREMMGNTEVLDASLSGLPALLQKGFQKAMGQAGKVLAQGGVLFATCALCGVASSCIGKEWEGSFSPVALCGTAALLALGIGQVNSVVNLCGDAIREMSVFANTLFPSVAAACAAAGSPLAGSTASVAAMLMTSGLISVITGIFFPAVYIYIAVIAADAAVGNELMGKIASFIKWAVLTSLKLCLTLYMAYSGVAGALAAATDAAALKTAKFAMSGAIPVVGSIVSDAAGAVLTGAGIVKNSVGVFGLVGVLAICITPFISAGIYFTVYKAAAALSSVVTIKPMSRLVDGISDGFGMALGMMGTVAVLLFISIVMAILMVRPA